MKRPHLLLPVLSCLAVLLMASPPVSSQPPMNYRGGGGGGRPGGSNTAFLRGDVVLSPDSEGGKELPGQGVVVQVIRSLKEKKYTVVGERGSFMIFGITPGQAIVSFSMMGYETLEKVVDLVPGENRFVANLKPVTEKLEGAIIKEYVNPISVINDTVIFHASAVKVEKGEMAIDILEQMPGVEVTDDGIKVMNEQVKNVYIDGALLFGDAPMTALKNLAAEDVTTIKSYQEYANKDPHHKISKNEEKQRVLDVQTKSKPKFIKAGDFIAGGGFDTDTTYHKFRYTLGANLSLFSEKLILQASTNVNNINDASNRRRGSVFQTASSGGSPDLRTLKVDLNATRKWMSPTTRNFVLGSVRGGYSYNDSYDVTESITQMLYFPGEQFDSREVEKSSFKAVTRKTHTFNLGGEKALRDGSIELGGTFRLNKNINNSFTTESNVQDGQPAEGSSTSNVRNAEGSSASMNFSFKKGFIDKWRVTLAMDYSGSENGFETVRRDTTLSTLTKTVLDIDGTDKAHSLSVAPSLRYEVTDNLSLSLRYTWSDSYNVSQHLAFDTTNPGAPVEDPVNTRTWTTDERVNSFSAGLSNHFDLLDANLRVRAGWKFMEVGSEESYPVAGAYGGPFNGFTGSASFGNESTVNHWSLEWNTGISAPAVEQIAPNIDNSNRYSVEVGNPALRQSRTHNFELEYQTVVGSERRTAIENEKMYGKQSGFGRRRRQETEYSTLSVTADYTVRMDPVVVRQNYYKSATYIPSIDYTMPAQSTLTTYENAPASRSAGITVRFGTQIKPIMCILNTSGSFSWVNSPSYVNELLTMTDEITPRLSVSLRSNFSRKVRLNLGVNGAYNRSSNDQGNFTEYFTERINFGGEVNGILQHLYFGGNYFKLFTQGQTYGKFNDNILNVRLGGRFGPKNNFDLSLSANDVFNTTTGFSTSMNANYVKNTWNHQFGRYVMLTLAYRFNQGGGRGPGGGGFGGGFAPRF